MQTNPQPKQSIKFSRDNNNLQKLNLMFGSYSHFNSAELCKLSSAVKDTWSFKKIT